MKINRKNLRNLILKEMKLIREGSVKNLIVEMAEIIEQHMIQTGRNRISVREALRILRVHHPELAGFNPAELEEFFLDSLAEGMMDFADLGYDVLTTETGREIEVVVRHVDNEDSEFF